MARGGILGIDLKRDADAIAVGAGLMMVLLVIPGVSDMIYNKILGPVRNKFSGTKES
jgi:hypothetical protein